MEPNVDPDESPLKAAIMHGKPLPMMFTEVDSLEGRLKEDPDYKSYLFAAMWQFELKDEDYPRRFAARHRRLPWFRLSCRRKVLDTGKSRIRELILGWVPKCFEGGRWY